MSPALFVIGEGLTGRRACGVVEAAAPGRIGEGLTGRAAAGWEGRCGTAFPMRDAPDAGAWACLWAGRGLEGLPLPIPLPMRMAGAEAGLRFGGMSAQASRAGGAEELGG